MRIPFNGDEVSGRIDGRVKVALKINFSVAQQFSLYNTKCSLNLSKRDQNPTDVISKSIYGFTCTCVGNYLGRTEEMVSTRFYEQIPRNLRLKAGKVFTSANARLFLDSRHEVNVSNVFEIINRQETPTLHLSAKAIKRCY